MTLVPYAGVVFGVYCLYLLIFLVYSADKLAHNSTYNHRIIRKYYFFACLDFFRVHIAGFFEAIFFEPEQCLKHFKLWSSRQLVKIELTEYYRQHCSDSDCPDQISMGKINFWNFVNVRRYTRQSGPLVLTPSSRSKERTFDLRSVNVDVFSRFIELLPSITLQQFSKTSKNIHLECLLTRGIEFSFLDQSKPLDEMFVSRSGRLMGRLDPLRFKEPDVARHVFCLDTLRASGSVFDVCFNKTYKQLILEFANRDFNSNFERALDHYLHDGVKSVKIFIYNAAAEGAEGESPKLENLIKLLKTCAKATKLGVSFHGLDYTNFLLTLKQPAFLHLDPGFQEIRTEIEDWSLSRPDLEFFKLIYNGHGYMLHENKLKRMEQSMKKQWFLAAEYPFGAALNEVKSQNEFLQQLECPYPFEPFCYHQYLI